MQNQAGDRVGQKSFLTKINPFFFFTIFFVTDQSLTNLKLVFSYIL